jgi:hypothetical protein
VSDLNKVTRFFKCPKTGIRNPSCNGCSFKHTRGPETGEEKIFPTSRTFCILGD